MIFCLSLRKYKIIAVATTDVEDTMMSALQYYMLIYMQVGFYLSLKLKQCPLVVVIVSIIGVLY